MPVASRYFVRGRLRKRWTKIHVRYELTRQRFWLGSAAALMSAVSFSSNVVLSKLAYDFGANLHALNLIRASVFLGCLIVAVWLSGSQVSIKRAEIYRC